MNKKCKKCELELDVSNFPKNGKYYGSYCKPCNRALMNERAYYKKDSYQAKQLEYKEKNKNKLKDWHRQNYINNKETILKQSQENYQKNKKSVCNRTKRYREENADWYREYKRQWRNLPNNKLRGNISRGMWGCLKGKQKNSRTMKYVGCTVDELWEYLKTKFKEGMTVENYGEWHVDHIKPLYGFDFNGDDIEEQLRIAWHYTNLQPLWREENLSKGKR